MMSAFDDVSPTFCTLPWIHLASNPNGTAKMCCIARSDLHGSDGRLLSFEKDSIAEIWNSPAMVETRKKMLAGEKVPDCAQCYSEEKLGTHSMRIGFNEKWHLQERDALLARVEESKANEYKMKSMPWYYDLRQGNLCNLKCRSCAPENSVSIEKEYEQLVIEDIWFKHNVAKPALSESYRSWFKSEFFNNQLIAEIPNVKKLYFTGGEPTLIESNYKLLELCISKGHASNIELMFNTNLTNLNDRFMNIIRQFKHVMLNLSIEGYGVEQEYLRGNSKWTIIARNLERLAAEAPKSVHLLLTPVIQSSNVLTITKLFTFVEELNEKYGGDRFHFMPIILTEPKYLAMDLLPDAIRRLAAERLENYIRNSKIVKYDKFFEPRLQQIITQLKTPHHPSPERLKVFINFTKGLDKKRNQDFKVVFAELFNLWGENDPNFKWESETIV